MEIISQLEEAKRLLKSCLKEFDFDIEGDLKVDDEWRHHFNFPGHGKPRKLEFKGKYYPNSSRGKLLNKIDDFLNALPQPPTKP